MTSASGEFVVSDSGRIGLERVVVQCRLEKTVQWIIAKGIQTQPGGVEDCCKIGQPFIGPCRLEYTCQ